MRARLLFFKFLLAAAAVPSAAQTPKWQQIGLRLGLGIQCGYFWNRGEGVIATGSGQFYYLRNGAWHAGLKLPYGALINSIRCFDGKTLYAPALNRFNGASQLWKSVDSGITWSQASVTNAWPGQSNNGPDVYWSYRSNAPVLWGSTVVRLDSQDLAATFDFFGTGPPSYSTDGGRSWVTRSLLFDSITGYNYYSGSGVCADRINKLYYATSESGYPGMFRSTDSGRTWICLGGLPQTLFMMDDVEGIYDKTFFQTSKGIYETTDRGATWVPIGGPTRLVSDDARFCVFGCTGEAVIAFDDGGGVWIANDWDAPDPAELASSFTASPKICDTAVIVVTAPRNFEQGRLRISVLDSSGLFSLLSPDTIALDSAAQKIRISFSSRDLAEHSAQLSIEPLDSGLCPIIHPIYGEARLTPPIVSVVSPVVLCTAGASAIYLSDLDCDSLRISKISTGPSIQVLAFDSVVRAADSVLLSVLPAGKDTTERLTVRIEGTREPSGVAFDTTVGIIVTTSHTRSTLGWPSQSQMTVAQPDICTAIDTSIIIWNNGCDTVLVDLASGNMTGGGWSVMARSGMHALYPGQTDTIRVHFFSSVPGKYPISLEYSYRYGVSLQDLLDFQLTATVPSAGPSVMLAPSRFDFGDRSFCDGDTTVDMSFQNLRCDSVWVSNVHFLHSNSFQLATASDSLLPPAGVLTETVFATASPRGIAQDTLELHVSNASGTFSLDTVIPFRMNIVRGSAALSVSAAAVDVGTTYRCEERDTFVVLRDTGCDSVCITAISLSGTGFTIARGNEARCLGSNETDTVWLHTAIDTSDQQIENVDTLQVENDGSASLGAVVLSRGIQYPTPWKLRVLPAGSTRAGSDERLEIVQRGRLPDDVTALRFSLFYDDDILGYTGADEPAVSSPVYYRRADGVACQTFLISPVTSDSILATLHFTPYVTRASNTAITLDSIQLVSSFDRPQPCIATIDTSGTTFSLLAQCGTEELAGFLRSGIVRIDEVHSSQQGIDFSIFSNFDTPGSELAISDALGRTCWTGNISLAEGEHRISVAAALPSGFYMARLRSEDVVSAKKFVVKN